MATLPDTFAQILPKAPPDASTVLNAQSVVQYWNHGAQAVCGHTVPKALRVLGEKDAAHIKVQCAARLLKARFHGPMDSTPDGISMVSPTSHITVNSTQRQGSGFTLALCEEQAP